MTTKLRGGRLEAEVDRARTEGNWKRMTELMTSIKSKQSGMEDMSELAEAEIQLETFLEQQGEMLRPRADNADSLRAAESLLLKTVRDRGDSDGAVLEAHLLLAKLHYACAQYPQALKDIECSGMERANTPFRTLRALRLVAEAYAIKGLCIETQDSGDKSSSQSQKSFFCFEKAAELAISYVSELEKSIGTSNGKSSTGTPVGSGSVVGVAGRQEKMGDLLECCLERVAMLRVKETSAERNTDGEGIEWYRRIITCLGDKSTGERLQQKLSRQLAELLLRAVPFESRSTSQAVNAKTQNLSFYTGSQRGYFSPTSRTEEIILLLLISEVLSTREVVLSRSDDLAASRHHSLRNAKSVYNLLTLVLSTIRQYTILSNIYERAMKFANQDTYLWQQFGLSLLCRGRWLRAARVLNQSIATHGDEAATQHLLAAQLHIQQLGQYDVAFEHATKAAALCIDGPQRFLKPRCELMAAIAQGLRAQCEPSWELRRKGLLKAVTLMEACVQADPHDYLAMYYCALYHAIARDLESARDRCARSLELNAEQPAAIMLLALVFSADGDLKGALELVISALKDFPSHYGLLVLRLHIETKFGRIEESLDTCSHLLEFWRKRELPMDEDRSQMTLSAADVQTMLREGSIKAGTPSVGARDVTPVGLGLSNSLLGSSAASQSAFDMSLVDSGVAQSEAGGQSTASGSGGGYGSASSATWTRFRAQANMWLALAELFLLEGRLADVGPCVEQAITLFPHSHQALYLKGRLMSARAEKSTDENIASTYRSESKAALLSALALCPSHTSSMAHLAGLYSAEGNVKMAEQMYKELVRVDPLSCDWWQKLGHCQMQRDMPELASQSYATASQLDRSTPLLPYTAIPLVFPTSF